MGCLRAIVTTSVLLALGASAQGQSTPLNPGGYSQNFDSMGTTGTTPPAGWSVWTLPGSNGTWSSTIPASGVGGGTQVVPSGSLGIFNQNAGTPVNGSANNNGLNLGFTASPTDRALGSSPTSVAGNALQLALQNQTGGAITELTIGYAAKVGSAWQNNELPGYRVFVSTTGTAGPFVSVASLDSVVVSTDPTGSQLVRSALVTLSTAVGSGSTVWIRFVDDNAAQTSPDQIFAIDNVSVIAAGGAEVGACCASDGTCVLVLDAGSCAGTFLGLNTVCSPNPCPQPPSGACCSVDGSCTVTTQALCTGNWLTGQVCSPNPCPPPQGACCAASGACSLTAQADCAGSWNLGTPCQPNPCPEPGSIRFAVIGDYGVDNSTQLAVADRFKTFNPQFVCTTGDNTYFTNTDITNWDRTQGKYYAQFIKLPPASVYLAQGSAVNNFFPVMGNHDWDVGGSAASYTGYFELPGNERYYAFERGPVKFFMLSSDGRETSSNAVNGVQYNWFINEYNQPTSARWKLVFFHHPAYTYPSNHGPDTTMRAWNFQNLPGITAVINGHNHNMQRINVSGVRFFVNGSGGNGLYSINGTVAGGEFQNASQNGFQIIEASDARITFRFISSGGQTLDTFVLEAPGACCTGSSCSIVASAGACAGGDFRGPGVACGTISTNPITCCPANYNQVDGLTPSDIFAFLNGYFAGEPGADFNNDGVRTPSDIFAFLNAYFAGCSIG